jgi:hypothetical protein
LIAGQRIAGQAKAVPGAGLIGRAGDVCWPGVSASVAGLLTRTWWWRRQWRHCEARTAGFDLPGGSYDCHSTQVGRLPVATYSTTAVCAVAALTRANSAGIVTGPQSGFSKTVIV